MTARNSVARYLVGSLTFVIHQVAGPLMVLLVSGALTAFSVGWWGSLHRLTSVNNIHWILTGMPFFPVEIGVGMLIGWFFERLLRHRSMLWVWVLPLLSLWLVPLTTPPGVPVSARSGQEMFFFASLGYSAGAWLARKISTWRAPASAGLA